MVYSVVKIKFGLTKNNFPWCLEIWDMFSLVYAFNSIPNYMYLLMESINHISIRFKPDVGVVLISSVIANQYKTYLKLRKSMTV